MAATCFWAAALVVAAMGRSYGCAHSRGLGS